MNSANIELHIHELVLDGLTGIDRAAVDLAVRHELARFLTEQGLPPNLAQGSEIASLDGGEFHMASGSTTEVIGSQIARAVYGGLSNE